MPWVLGGAPCFHVTFYKYWEELGAAQHWKIYDHDQFVRIENEDGKVFTMYSDIDLLEQQMMEFAPEDEELIREFIKATRDSMNFELAADKPQELYGLIDYLKMVKMVPFFKTRFHAYPPSVENSGRFFKGNYIEIRPPSNKCSFYLP